MKNQNNVINDLFKCGLIKKSAFKVISNTTRNAKIKVIKEKNDGIIFLEKNILTNKYYKKNYKSKLKKGRFFSETKFLSGKKTISKRIDDDQRRVKNFKNFIKNKIVCDFGCGFGGFLIRSKKIAKKVIGVELGENCIRYLNKNKITNFKDIDEYQNDFDLITLFHTLHYLPNQIEILKKIRKKLKKSGKLIIEVPHAKDLLLMENAFPEFKKFTFCKESLIWHTEKSLKKFLLYAGYKNIKINFFQRYDFENHLGWFLYKKPGGHGFFKNIIDLKLKENYRNFIEKNKLSDTLIAVASK